MTTIEKINEAIQTENREIVLDALGSAKREIIALNGIIAYFVEKGVIKLRNPSPTMSAQS